LPLIQVKSILKREQHGKYVVISTLLQAQRFLDSYSAVFNRFNLQRYFVRAEHYRRLRANAFTEWNYVVV